LTDLLYCELTIRAGSIWDLFHKPGGPESPVAAGIFHIPKEPAQ
jgi:hypothetical protein